MEYRKEIIEGDKTIYETFEGTPEEILEVSRSLNTPKELVASFALDADKIVTGVLKKLKEDEETDPDENQLIYNQKDAIEFIHDKLPKKILRYQIEEILDLDESYMRSIGIIKD